MKINKYFPLASLYFFFNSLFLPLGLLYTSLLAPLFYAWLIMRKQQFVILKFLLLLCPFIIAHLINGVVVVDYIKSLLVLFTTYIFGYTLYLFVLQYNKLGHIFRLLIISNFILTIVAIMCYPTEAKEIFWYVNSVSGSIQNFSRLKMLTYEASYYSLLLVPLLFYYLVHIIYQQKGLGKNYLFLFMLIIPLVLSFSMGIISGVLLTMAIFFFAYVFRIRMKRRFFNQMSFIVVVGALLTGLLFLFYRNNPLFLRIEDIFSGTDTSAKGRTFEAFLIAYEIAKEKSLLFGVGLGQLKYVGRDIIIDFYNYPSTISSVSIPNAAAETIAIFGFLGFFIRLALQLYLFVYTKVYRSPYRFLLFTFVFIYQFTGSFITNTAEYVIWILAFSQCFPELSLTRLQPKTSLPQHSQPV